MPENSTAKTIGKIAGFFNTKAGSFVAAGASVATTLGGYYNQNLSLVNIGSFGMIGSAFLMANAFFIKKSDPPKPPQTNEPA